MRSEAAIEASIPLIAGETIAGSHDLSIRQDQQGADRMPCLRDAAGAEIRVEVEGRSAGAGRRHRDDRDEQGKDGSGGHVGLALGALALGRLSSTYDK